MSVHLTVSTMEEKNQKSLDTIQQELAAVDKNIATSMEEKDVLEKDIEILEGKILELDQSILKFNEELDKAKTDKANQDRELGLVMQKFSDNKNEIKILH